KITKDLGFNLLILHKDQDIGEFIAQDTPSRYMPEEYVHKLSSAGVATINHLLPILQVRLEWPEEKMPVIVVGTRGEVPIARRDPKKPFLDLVPRGNIIMGSQLARKLDKQKGSSVKLLGHEFTIAKIHEPRGTKDDITVWVNLAEAQEMFGQTGRINAILALECNCASPDRLGDIRREVAAILPDTQVEEWRTKALVRAEARNRAAREGKESVTRTAVWAKEQVGAARENRAALRLEKEATAAWLVPLVMLGSVVWLGVLTFLNVRERSVEIGILRALGVKSMQVFALFLAKAALIGLLGALFGYLGGWALGALWGGEGLSYLFNPELLLAVLIAAPVVCCLAGWFPALVAARQDPAVILREG
ncbi:MAG: ABC transporter permease, partial [Gemmataceae bacterium]